MSFRGKKRTNSSSYPSSQSVPHKKTKFVDKKHFKTNNNVKKWYVYVLELRDDCWYVGTTVDPTSRLEAHRSGKGGAEWTRQHPPVKGFSSNLKEVNGDEEQARLEEDAEVKRLMKEHGIENVRGGSYSTTTLSRTDVKALSKELRHASGGCLRCGHKSHWATNCYAGKDVAGNSISDDENTEKHKTKTSKSKQLVKESSGKQRAVSQTARMKVSSQPLPSAKQDTCHRCGRTGHWIKDCYAKVDIDGHSIESNQVETKGRKCTEERNNKDRDSDNKCFRCGRKGHLATECYAKSHANGYQLQ